MDARNNIATDLFYKVRSRFSGLKLGDESGQVTIIPENARFFDFDYMEGEKAIGHVSVSLAEPNSMKVYFSSGITESMDKLQKNKWYDFLKELRHFAKRRLMSFDTRDISKDMLDKRDYYFLSQNNKSQNNMPTQPIVGENIMSESTMYGTKTVSYQKLLDTRLIIKHSQAVMDDTQPGARTRNISALFVENQDGERFKYPFIHLAGARAMQRHVANGGLPYDDLGKSIISMSEQIAQLKSFNNYVVRNDLMNSNTNNIVEKSQAQLNSLREQISKLSKQPHYEAYKENFIAQEQLEVPEEVVEDFVEKFTVKNFKEDIKSVFPLLYKLMQEDNTLGYDDIVAMTQQEVRENEIDIESYDPFSKFENWVMELGEDSAIVSKDPEEQQQAIKELQELVKEHFPAGVDGSNAIESLKGIIEDPKLFQEIKNQAKEDPDSCVRGLVKKWLESNAPEVIDQLDFGDFVEDANTEEIGHDEVSPKSASHILRKLEDGIPMDEIINDFPELSRMMEIIAGERGLHPDDDFEEIEDILMNDLEDLADKHDKGYDNESREISNNENNDSLSLQELAEFIHSFYDRESGTFPKGPEGVCTMVGKKFGEQAEHVARKFVERMAPQQTTNNNPELAELSRIKELSQW